MQSIKCSFSFVTCQTSIMGCFIFPILKQSEYFHSDKRKKQESWVFKYHLSLNLSKQLLLGNRNKIATLEKKNPDIRMKRRDGGILLLSWLRMIFCFSWRLWGVSYGRLIKEDYSNPTCRMGYCLLASWR